MFQEIAVCEVYASTINLLGFFRVDRGSEAFGVHQELIEKHNEKDSPTRCFRFTFRLLSGMDFRSIFGINFYQNYTQKMSSSQNGF